MPETTTLEYVETVADNALRIECGKLCGREASWLAIAPCGCDMGFCDQCRAVHLRKAAERVLDGRDRDNYCQGCGTVGQSRLSLRWVPL